MITDPEQMRAWRKAQPSVSSLEMDLQIKAGLEATRIAKAKSLNSTKPKSTLILPKSTKRKAEVANT